MKLEGFRQDSLTPPAHNESWRFTHLAKILPPKLTPAHGFGTADIVFAGDRYVIHELPAGVTINPPPQLAGEFWDELAAAGGGLGLAITTTPSRPLRVLIIRESGNAEHGTLAHLHIKVAPHQRLTLEQTIRGNSLGVTAQATALELSAGAVVEHGIVLQDGAEAFSVNRFVSELSAQSHLSQTFVVQGSRMTRLQIETTLQGEAAHASLASIAKLSGSSHVDIHSTLSHLSPRTTAQQLAKNLLADESKAIFTGKVYIAQNAQQVAAEQLNRNLLVSKRAHAIGQPQLEIMADDVKCSHGSTTGQIEEDTLFYLQSRSISSERAAALLTQAFTEEVLHQAPAGLHAFLRGEA